MSYTIRYIFFFAAMILYNLAANFAHPITPTFIQALDLPDYMFGLMLAAMMLSNFLVSPAWGKLNTYFSSRRTLLIGCIGYGLSQLGFALSVTQTQILLARVLAGIFVGGCFVSFLTYVVNTAKPEHQAKFLTYSATIQAVFSAFGYLVGGLLGEFSIRATFLLQAAVLALSGIIFFFACEPDNTSVSKISVKQVMKESNPLQAFFDSRHFMNTALLLLFAMNILINFSNTGFDQAFNYFLKDQLGLTSAYNGLIKAAVGLISFVFNMTMCIWIIQKTDTQLSMTLLTLFCTAAAIGTTVSPWVAGYIGCGILLYAGYSVSLPVIQHMVAVQANPAQKNLVMGFYNATKSLGGILGSLMAGFAYTLYAKLPFIVVAVTYGLSLAVCAAYLLLSRKKQAVNV